MMKTYAKVRCLKDFRLALPDGNLNGRKGDITMVELRIAALMEKAELAEIIGVMQTEMEP